MLDLRCEGLHYAVTRGWGKSEQETKNYGQVVLKF
jgi:hypothetical protein